MIFKTSQDGLFLYFQSLISSDIIGIEPLVCVRVAPDTRLQPRVDPALGHATGAANSCLVRSGPKLRTLFLKGVLYSMQGPDLLGLTVAV